MTRTRAAAAAIVLAGGRATRFGGVDKMAVDVAGAPMLTTVLTAACAAGCSPVLALGPDRASLVPPAADDAVRWIPDSVDGEGPAAALAGAVADLDRSAPESVLLLAGDLPFLTADALDELLARLLAAAPDIDGIVAVDGEGRSQWHLSAWRFAALRRRISTQGAPPGSSLHALLGSLRIERWQPTARDGHEPWRDCDDPEELEAARRPPE